jgi:methionine transaminase
VTSRLPQVGTTIFTVMSALAPRAGAVNLGQGFPDFDCDPALVDAVHQAMREGLNQYPPMAGVPALRQAVADKIEALYGHRYDADTEITITAGATQAILTAVLAACTRATRSSCSSPATTATCPTSSWPAAPWCACR